MPNSFATGLSEGLVKGFTDYEGKKHEAETQQRTQDLERWTRIATSADLPDEDRQHALQQIQGIMQGKKQGGKSGGGPLSPILQQLHKLIGASHAQKPMGNPGEHGGDLVGKAKGNFPGGGGMTENLPNGQPAPGTAGSQPSPTPLNVAPNGRPTLQGTGPAAGDPQSQPGVAPAPQTRPPVQTGNPLDAQIKQAQSLLDAIPPEKTFARERAQKALDALQSEKTKGEAADYYDERKQSRLETGREALEKIKTQAASDKQEMVDRHKKELEDAKLEGGKALEAAKAAHAKELKELADKDAAELKKYIAEHPTSKKATAPEAAIKTGQGVTGSKDDATTKASALYGLMTNHNPSFGLGKSNQRDAYNKARAEIIDDLGPDGVAKLQASYKAGSGALANVVKQRATVGAFENTFESDLDNARKAAEDVPRKQASLFNSWQQLAQAKLADNSPLAKFRVATQTAINQYARLMFSATGGGTSTDTARADAEKLLSTAMAQGSYGAAIDQMQLEVKNRTKGLDAEIQKQLSEIGEGGGQTPKTGAGRGGAQPAAQAAPKAPPAVGTVEDGHRFKGGNPADPNSWEKVQ